MENQTKIPEGMIEVTKEKFFSALNADRRDIMPSTRNAYYTVWETIDRTLWGWNSHGWKTRSHLADPEICAVYPNALEKIK